MGAVSTTPSTYTQTKKTNEDIDVLLFRCSQKEKDMVALGWGSFWFRYLCVGDDNPAVSHKSLFLLNVNAIRIIQILILQQLQYLIHICKILATKLDDVNCKSDENDNQQQQQKFKIRNKHSCIVIRDLDIANTELNRRIAKFAWRTWLDTGIQNTYHWYIDNYKHFSNRITTMSSDFPKWKYDIFKEYIIYPMFCDHFMNNLNPIISDSKDSYGFLHYRYFVMMLTVTIINNGII